MKQIFYAIIISTLLSGCAGLGKISKTVNQSTETIAATPQQHDWLTINLPDSAATHNTFTKGQNYFVPALVYWGWNSTLNCEIAPYTSALLVRNAIYKAADELQLKQHLGDKKVVINLQQAPGKFVYENKGDVVYLLFVTVSDIKESITPVPVDLQATYELHSPVDQTFKATTTIPNQEQKITNSWSSKKGFTRAHLNSLNLEAQRMGTELVKQIIARHGSTVSQ
ncbi:hypothetical protein [Pontibacter populi]|uniref:DUF4136 domain-containing protein n=1 Tax=Pontibacter populi TaxID=890055 RepID=A0ABV1RSS7_9BACT